MFPGMYLSTRVRIHIAPPDGTLTRPEWPREARPPPLRILLCCIEPSQSPFLVLFIFWGTGKRFVGRHKSLFSDHSKLLNLNDAIDVPNVSRWRGMCSTVHGTGRHEGRSERSAREGRKQSV